MSILIEGFSSSQDHLKKLNREIWRLHEAQFSGVLEDIIDHGINASITAWHLHEIVAKERRISVSNYRRLIKRKCVYLGLIHDLTTYAKHFKVSRPQRSNAKDNLNIGSTTRAYQSEDDWKMAKQFMSECGVEIETQYKPTDYKVLKVDDIELEEILEEVKRFWVLELTEDGKFN